jgi:SET domain-containing protein
VVRLFRRYQLDRRLYIMALGDGVYLNARQKGGIARYINHSCRPNCKVELWTVKGVVRAVVVAMCPIAPGEELTFDYQWERRRGRSSNGLSLWNAGMSGYFRS